jgi:hypothetical protein
VTPRTLRRKLQKKKKRKGYTPCVGCDERTECRVKSLGTESGTPILIRGCGAMAWPNKTYGKCQHIEVLQWTGKPD